ncbi:MAG: SpaA isopeptide-forming pilin-related protein, partial [Lysinibacillus sp.]
LGIEKGKDYTFDFFYMERHTTESNLKITTSIAFKPEISATKAVDKTAASNGDELNYTFTAKNTGKKDATNLTLTDVLDEGLSFVENSVKINGQAVTGATYDKDTRKLSIPISELKHSESITISFKAKAEVDDSLFDDNNHYTIKNKGVLDSYTTNTVETIITGGASDLNVSKLVKVKGSASEPASRVDAQSGDTIQYTINVTNNGASQRSAFTIKDVIPNGVTYVDGTVKASSTDSKTVLTPSYDKGILSVSASRLGKGETITITFDATVDKLAGSVQSKEISNIATIDDSIQSDPAIVNVKEASISVTKQVSDVNKDDIAGAIFKFILVNEAGKQVGTKEITMSADSSKNVVTFDHLPVGEQFTILEEDPSGVYADKGYRYDKTTATVGGKETAVSTETIGETKYMKVKGVNVTDNGTAVVFTNKYEKNDGSIKVIKTDKLTGKPLEGAEFTLSSGGKKVATETTNSDGEIVFTKLTYGTYELQETKVPSGYKLDGTVRKVEVNSDKVVSCNITNDGVGSVAITKVDTVTKKPLEGVEFGIYQGGKLITTVKTDQDGKATFTGLAYGDYE